MSENNTRTRSSKDRSAINRRRFLAGAVGTAGLGMVAGCNGVFGGGSGSGTITLGASAALTGSYSVEGQATQKGYQLWVDHINDSGGLLKDDDEPGLLGREVELVVQDDQSDPSRAVNLYQDLINQEDVDLMMGPYSSAVTNAVIPVVEQNEMACVSSFGSDTSVYTERDVSYMVQAIAPSPTYVTGAIDLAVENGAETLAAVYEDTAFPTSVVEGHIPYAEEQGLEVVHTEPYPGDVNDYTPIMRRVQSEDPDIVIGGGYTPDAIGLTEAARSIGYTTGIFSWVVGGMAPDLADSLGADTLAISGDHWWTPTLNVPHNEELTEVIREYHGDEYDDLHRGIDYHFPGAYGALLVLEQAVRNVGSIDQTAIAEELHSLEMGVPWGNGQYEVDEQGVQVGHRPALGQWQEADEGDGMSREAIYPEDSATAEPIYPHPGWN